MERIETVLGPVPAAEMGPTMSHVHLTLDILCWYAEPSDPELRRLAEAGVGLEALSAVLLTHYHTDHCADLAALLFGLRNPRYAGRPRLVIRGAPGLLELLERLGTAEGQRMMGELLDHVRPFVDRPMLEPFGAPIEDQQP